MGIARQLPRSPRRRRRLHGENISLGQFRFDRRLRHRWHHYEDPMRVQWDVIGHIGGAKLYTDIPRNGYNVLYLTLRAIGQAGSQGGHHAETRSLQDGILA